jgi:tRNA (adenine-N(1)-)-methyltransferase non-catalytic subunit
MKDSNGSSLPRDTVNKEMPQAATLDKTNQAVGSQQNVVNCLNGVETKDPVPKPLAAFTEQHDKLPSTSSLGDSKKLVVVEEMKDREAVRTTAEDEPKGFTPPLEMDPLLIPPSATVREGDHVLLMFGDKRQIFAHCVTSWKGKNPPVKISKRSYPTANLVGLPYGTVLELDHTRGGLVPLPPNEDVVPDCSDYLTSGGTPVGNGAHGGSSPGLQRDCRSPTPLCNTEGGGGSVSGSNLSAGSGQPSSDDEVDEIGGSAAERASSTSGMMGSTLARSSALGSAAVSQNKTDNRHLVDNNEAQTMTQKQLMEMKLSGQYSGSTIVQRLIENSSTFGGKTEFSKAKYLARKTKKYQQRCRLVRCTGATVSEAMFLKNPRMVLNLREDSLAQMLSYANIYAGCQTLVMESCMGIITAAVAQRMGGYGKVVSVYTVQQPSWSDMIKKFNLSFAENHSVKWIHSGDVFGEESDGGKVSDGAFEKDGAEKEEIDLELRERRQLQWPCPLQDHTKNHLTKMTSSFEQADFLSKRCSRFARKLTRHTTGEVKKWLNQQSDSLIIACKYDPTETLIQLLPYLAASCPFVVFGEHMEPLIECFRELQKQDLAINLRLTDTWLREYQVLPGRSHPNMTMSQSGGYLLSGIKICPETGHNDIQEDQLRDIKAQAGGRRGKKAAKNGKGKGKKGGIGNGNTHNNIGGRDSKKARLS